MNPKLCDVLKSEDSQILVTGSPFGGKSGIGTNIISDSETKISLVEGNNFNSNTNIFLEIKEFKCLYPYVFYAKGS